MWTTDAAIENRHYLPWLATPEQIGYKIMITNLSDVASMGRDPALRDRVALRARGRPGRMDRRALPRPRGGSRRERGRHRRRKHDALALGFSVDIGLLGEVERDRLMLRSAARPGDALLVTDTVGDAYQAWSASSNREFPCRRRPATT